MTAPRFGGQPRLRVLAVGGPELTDLILSIKDGGGKLSTGLRERVSEAHEGRFAIEVESLPGAPVKDLGNQLGGREDTPDVALVSVFADVVGNGRLDIDGFREDTRRMCNLLKQRGTYVLIANVSTFDPEDSVTNYHSLSADTPSLRAHKVAAAIIDLSHELGISVIDVDRLLAELGAADHVESIGRYSAEACGIVCAEVQRVLEDYGFFEERPLLLQAGKGSGR